MDFDLSERPGGAPRRRPGAARRRVAARGRARGRRRRRAAAATTSGPRWSSRAGSASRCAEERRRPRASARSSSRCCSRRSAATRRRCRSRPTVLAIDALDAAGDGRRRRAAGGAARHRRVAWSARADAVTATETGGGWALTGRPDPTLYAPSASSLVVVPAVAPDGPALFCGRPRRRRAARRPSRRWTGPASWAGRTSTRTPARAARRRRRRRRAARPGRGVRVGRDARRCRARCST